MPVKSSGWMNIQDKALRKKKDASVVVATSLVRDNVCDAVIAPGSTGVLL